MTERPTKEQIDRWRYLLAVRDGEAAALPSDARAAEDLHVHKVAVALIDAYDALTADLTAAREERDEQTRLVDRAYDSLHPQILARAEKAEAALAASEAARETAELALVELQTAAVDVIARCEHGHGQALVSRDAWLALSKAYVATPIDLADSLRRRYQAEGLEMAAEELTTNWDGLVSEWLQKRAAELRGGAR